MQKIETSIELNNTRQLKSLLPIDSLPPILYHYTSLDAIISILRSGKFHVSSIEQFNDKAELRYSVSIFRAYVDRFLAVEPTAEGSELFQHIQKQLDTIETSGIYVASFSANGNEWGMWRLYGDRGRGFSFGFPFYETGHWGGIPGRCHYDTSRADEFCISALTTVRDALLNEIKVGKQLDVGALAASFLWRISYFGLFFKPHAWADEREWRLVFINPATEIKTRPDGSKFIEIPNAERFPIGAVCSGPLCEESSIKKLQECIDEVGLAIPLRRYPVPS